MLNYTKVYQKHFHCHDIFGISIHTFCGILYSLQSEAIKLMTNFHISFIIN